MFFWINIFDLIWFKKYVIDSLITVFWSLVGLFNLLSLLHYPHFHSQFCLFKIYIIPSRSEHNWNICHWLIHNKHWSNQYISNMIHFGPVRVRGNWPYHLHKNPIYRIIVYILLLIGRRHWNFVLPPERVIPQTIDSLTSNKV